MFAIEVRNTCRPGPPENHARFAKGEVISPSRNRPAAPVAATKWSDALRLRPLRFGRSLPNH